MVDPLGHFNFRHLNLDFGLSFRALGLKDLDWNPRALPWPYLYYCHLSEPLPPTEINSTSLYLEMFLNCFIRFLLILLQKVCMLQFLLLKAKSESDRECGEFPLL